MKNESVAVEVLQPPLPAAALMAKPIGGATRAPADEALLKLVADLREQVMRQGQMIAQLQAVVLTVCCQCGEIDCRKAPHVPARYWQRFGPSSWGYFRRAEPEAARTAEREHYEFHRRASGAYGPGPGPSFFDERLLTDPTTTYERPYW